MYLTEQKNVDIMSVSNVARGFFHFRQLVRFHALTVRRKWITREVAKMDSLLSLAITGGDYEWI